MLVVRACDLMARTFRNIEERYQNMAKVVRSHALSAIGLTAFKKTSEAENPSIWRVDNFNFLLSLQV